MTNILVLNSSVSGEASVSKILVRDTVERLLEAHPRATVVQRDLDLIPVPHLTSSTIAGVRGVATTQAELGALALSDELIAELRAADTVVIGAPMYNFSIPTSLRAWFDHVLRPRVTFSYSDAGPQGLLTGKRVIVIESRGGMYSEGPAKAIDFQEPYLRFLLSFIGLTDVTFIHAEKLGFGAEAREAALADARAKIAIAASQPLAEAA
jgi:FMN-dependent NADH-azoreductase